MSKTSVAQSVDFVEVIPMSKSAGAITGGEMLQLVKVVASLLIVTSLFLADRFPRQGGLNR